MDDTTSKPISRRDLLKGVALLAGTAVLRPAQAQGKAPQSAMQYQDKPKGDAECSNCLQFIPGSEPHGNGHLQGGRRRDQPQRLVPRICEEVVIVKTS